MTRSLHVLNCPDIFRWCAWRFVMSCCDFQEGILIISSQQPLYRLHMMWWYYLCGRSRTESPHYNQARDCGAFNVRLRPSAIEPDCLVSALQQTAPRAVETRKKPELVTRWRHSEDSRLGSVYLREQKSFSLDKLQDDKMFEEKENQTFRLKNLRNQSKRRKKQKQFGVHSSPETEGIKSKIESPVWRLEWAKCK